MAERAFAVLRRGRASSVTGSDAYVVALSQGSFTASVSQAANGDVCLKTDDGAAGISISCGSAEFAATHGLVMSTIGAGITPRITVLLPDGSSSVAFTGGTTSNAATPVVNNVATATVSLSGGVSYTLPNGTAQTWSIPAPQQSVAATG